MSRSARGVAFGLAFGPAAAQGFSRFGYALLVPGIRADLGWSFAQAGGVASANAAGYLIGALILTRIAQRIGLRSAFAIGLVSTVVTLLTSAFVSDYGLVLVVRFLAGVAGAIAFVAGGAIVARLAAEPGKASPLAIYFAGGGIGIAVSGLVIPWLAGADGEQWRAAWIGLGLMAALCAAIAWLFSEPAPIPAPVQESSIERRVSLVPIHIAYGFFGAGYIAYMTFVFALLSDRGATLSFRSLFWIALGLSAACSFPIWNRLPARLKGNREFALMNAATALGVLCVIPFHNPVLELMSAIIFGGSFLAVVGSVTSLAKSLTVPGHWTHVIGTLTGAFALGQCSGPLVSGVLSDRPGGVETGLWLSVALLGSASIVSLWQRG
jgi:predicted MFS family arabinose efflux permease